MVAIVVGTVVILGIIAVMVRMWRSPKGPEMTIDPVTRKGRERVNRSYAKHGWAKPYDADGNKIPRAERTPPDP